MKLCWDLFYSMTVEETNHGECDSAICFSVSVIPSSTVINETRIILDIGQIVKLCWISVAHLSSGNCFLSLRYHCGAFSCCRAWAPGRVGFSIWSTRAQQLYLGAPEHRLSSRALRLEPHSMWDLLRSGLESMSQEDCRPILYHWAIREAQK